MVGWIALGFRAVGVALQNWERDAAVGRRRPLESHVWAPRAARQAGAADKPADKVDSARGSRAERAPSPTPPRRPPPSLLPHPDPPRKASPRRTGMASSSCLASPAGAAALICRARRPRRRVACSASEKSAEPAWLAAGGRSAGGRLACGVLAAWAVASASSPVIAASQVGGFFFPSFSYRNRTAGRMEFVECRFEK